MNKKKISKLKHSSKIKPKHQRIIHVAANESVKDSKRSQNNLKSANPHDSLEVEDVRNNSQNAQVWAGLLIQKIARCYKKSPNTLKCPQRTYSKLLPWLISKRLVLKSKIQKT
ncbi:hypothetical protein AMECASPLE_011700 [Ameca splendens]|uniref:Uncharacterized protein n=1 Tax=Ameca splendens TaxID=208324 RepID=A0ABV0XE04_9TELE